MFWISVIFWYYACLNCLFTHNVFIVIRDLLIEKNWRQTSLMWHEQNLIMGSQYVYLSDYGALIFYLCIFFNNEESAAFYFFFLVFQPLLMQVRLFYNGTAVKGTLLLNKKVKIYHPFSKAEWSVWNYFFHFSINLGVYNPRPQKKNLHYQFLS